MRRTLIVSFSFALLAAASAQRVHADDDPAPAAPAADQSADAAVRAKWAEHTGDLPFTFGFAKGMQDVEVTGKPPLLFFTATW